MSAVKRELTGAVAGNRAELEPGGTTEGGKSEVGSALERSSPNANARVYILNGCDCVSF